MMLLNPTWNHKLHSPVRKPLFVRRIKGMSMYPSLKENQIVICSGFLRNFKNGNIVVLFHDGIEKIKRIEEVSKRSMFIIGDNARQSTDSRTFGKVPTDQIIGKIIWPRV